MDQKLQKPQLDEVKEMLKPHTLLLFDGNIVKAVLKYNQNQKIIEYDDGTQESIYLAYEKMLHVICHGECKLQQ